MSGDGKILTFDDGDTDDRLKCRSCADWGWPDSGHIKVCPKCEEWFCRECMGDHDCWTEGPE